MWWDSLIAFSNVLRPWADACKLNYKDEKMLLWEKGAYKHFIWCSEDNHGHMYSDSPNFGVNDYNTEHPMALGGCKLKHETLKSWVICLKFLINVLILNEDIEK